MIDDILSPYSEPAFERVARKRGYSRGGCTAFMLLAFGMAVVFFFGACALLTVIARHYYLETYGTLLAVLPRLGHPGVVDGTLEKGVPRVAYLVVYRIDMANGDHELVVLRVYHGAQPR